MWIGSEPLNIYWMKRDFRIMDNQVLREALGKPTILLVILEPSTEANYDFDIRHWRFIYQSVQDLRAKGLPVHLLRGEVINILEFLKSKYQSLVLFSHQETGNLLTYERDLAVKDFVKENNIEWHEFQTNAVVRGLKKRQGWDALWIKHMKRPAWVPPENFDNCLDDEELSAEYGVGDKLESKLNQTCKQMVIGGEDKAHQMMELFLNEKIESYWGSISYPEKSRYYCSFLSSYISWGNLTIRQIYQACEARKGAIRNKKSLEQYMARLKWHCHFIQKLELQPDIEFKNLSSAFDQIRTKRNKKLIDAWKHGETGYPLIDAAMRCVKQTGYLNFRLRSTVVSFFTHILWQPWQAGAGYLARQFLDYEPGIHFSQFQMQAGTTGINTIRIYNPIKQSKEKDKEGEFIKKWVPELADLPREFIHEPWKMTEMEQIMYGFRIGETYPVPIVVFEQAYSNAKDQLWGIKKSNTNKKVAQKILKKHARRSRKRN